jgi:hypothetical protein
LATPCNATISITTTSAGTALAALALELAALGSLAQFHDAARITSYDRGARQCGEDKPLNYESIKEAEDRELR